MTANEMRRLAIKLLQQADEAGTGPGRRALLLTAEQIL
ncbi:MAG: hypothetical protein JWL84_5178, partial [Rhodospirillales bacterium]|nr:hypothetical protein [Rhodospirillales bacterium]